MILLTHISQIEITATDAIFNKSNGWEVNMKIFWNPSWTYKTTHNRARLNKTCPVFERDELYLPCFQPNVTADFTSVMTTWFIIIRKTRLKIYSHRLTHFDNSLLIEVIGNFNSTKLYVQANYWIYTMIYFRYLIHLIHMIYPCAIWSGQSKSYKTMDRVQKIWDVMFIPWISPQIKEAVWWTFVLLWRSSQSHL